MRRAGARQRYALSGSIALLAESVVDATEIESVELLAQSMINGQQREIAELELLAADIGATVEEPTEPESGATEEHEDH